MRTKIYIFLLNIDSQNYLGSLCVSSKCRCSPDHYWKDSRCVKEKCESDNSCKEYDDYRVCKDGELI